MMRRLLVATIAALACLAFHVADASADDHQSNQDQDHQGDRTVHSVPEFDPLTIGGVVAVVAGGGVLLARRRKK